MAAERRAELRGTRLAVARLTVCALLVSCQPTPPQVKGLLSRVRDVAALDSAINGGSRGDVFVRLTDRNFQIRLMVDSVKNAGVEARAVDALKNLIDEAERDTDSRSRLGVANAARALGELGPAAASTAVLLERLSHHESSAIAQEAKAALSKVRAP